MSRRKFSFGVAILRLLDALGYVSGSDICGISVFVSIAVVVEFVARVCQHLPAPPPRLQDTSFVIAAVRTSLQVSSSLPEAEMPSFHYSLRSPEPPSHISISPHVKFLPISKIYFPNSLLTIRNPPIFIILGQFLPLTQSSHL
jgi:hypothetical protein